MSTREGCPGGPADRGRASALGRVADLAGVDRAVLGDVAKKALRAVALPSEYVGEHAHLSYAATTYGVQGATVDAAHTILSDATSAAGVYVGMIRGRETNRLHVVAESLADARVQFVSATERDLADCGLDHATAQVVEAVCGLIADGPVQRVNEAVAKLTEIAEQAEWAAARWAQTAERFDAQAHGLSNGRAGARRDRRAARSTGRGRRKARAAPHRRGTACLGRTSSRNPSGARPPRHRRGPSGRDGDRRGQRNAEAAGTRGDRASGE